MIPLATLLRAWRLRRIRWAMQTLSRRLETFEAAYGHASITPDETATYKNGLTLADQSASD